MVNLLQFSEVAKYAYFVWNAASFQLFWFICPKQRVRNVEISRRMNDANNLILLAFLTWFWLERSREYSSIIMEDKAFFIGWFGVDGDNSSPLLFHDWKSFFINVLLRKPWKVKTPKFDTNDCSIKSGRQFQSGLPVPFTFTHNYYINFREWEMKNVTYSFLNFSIFCHGFNF